MLDFLSMPVEVLWLADAFSPHVVPEPAMATVTAVRRAPPMDELFAVATRTIDRVFIRLKAGYR